MKYCSMEDAIKWLSSKEAERELQKLRNLDKKIEESLKVSSECLDRRMTI